MGERKLFLIYICIVLLFIIYLCMVNNLKTQKKLEIMGIQIFSIKIDGYYVEYDYQPEEPSELEYAGCCEEARIEKVMKGKRNITGIVSDSFLEEMEIKVLKNRGQY